MISFQFSFSNVAGLSFTVLGAPIEGPPGHYQFTDQPNSDTRCDHVRSPEEWD